MHSHVKVHSHVMMPKQNHPHVPKHQHVLYLLSRQLRQKPNIHSNILVHSRTRVIQALNRYEHPNHYAIHRLRHQLLGHRNHSQWNAFVVHFLRLAMLYSLQHWLAPRSPHTMIQQLWRRKSKKPLQDRKKLAPNSLATLVKLTLEIQRTKYSTHKMCIHCARTIFYFNQPLMFDRRSLHLVTEC